MQEINNNSIRIEGIRNWERLKLKNAVLIRVYKLYKLYKNKFVFSSSYTIQDDYRHYLGKNSIYFGNVINEIAVGDVASPRFYSGKATDNNLVNFPVYGKSSSSKQ